MTRFGVIQTSSYITNNLGIDKISKLLADLGRVETDIVCLPEQWLADNTICNFTVFDRFCSIAKEFSMGIIPGAFYHESDTDVIRRQAAKTTSMWTRNTTNVASQYGTRRISHTVAAAPATRTVIAAPIIGSDGDI